MLLHHLHLPLLTPYLHATALQSHLLSLHLAAKSSLTQSSSPSSLSSATISSEQATAASTKLSSSPPSPPPPPTLLTFQTPPTYTIGRRDISTTSAADISTLRHRHHQQGQDHRHGDSTTTTTFPIAAVHASPRGGQTTFHGPGQLTAFVVLDLRTHALTPRAHVRLLEEGVLGVCRRFGVEGMRTENPGVWVDMGERGGEEDEDEAGLIAEEETEEQDVKRRKPGFRKDSGISAMKNAKPTTTAPKAIQPPNQVRKLAAVGVHVRRGVTGYGVGINVTTDLGWFDRITACGLVGKRATSLERCGVVGVGVECDAVAAVWAGEMARLIQGVEGVRRVGVQEVLGTRRWEEVLRETEVEVEEKGRGRWS